jgi:hypothetical protein
MINDKEAAEIISRKLLQVNGLLNESIELVETRCSKEELIGYKKAIGRLINSAFEGVLESLYEEHPSLKPCEYD